MNRQRTPARNNCGAAAMEFGLVATLIVVTIIAALAGVANTSTTMWGDGNSKVKIACYS